MYQHDIAIDRWRRQHFAGHPRTPFLLTGAGIQSDHFAFQRTKQHQAITGTNRTGNRRIEVFFPDHLAAHAIQCHDQAFDVGGIDHIAVDGGHQHVEGFTLAFANRTAPLLLQYHFFFEVGQIGWRKILFTVAAATDSQDGQGQQCGIFPTHHFTHPL
ncbi:hypothetical protein D9M68_830720 [compost metagenome]